ncbi:hypothetical protein L1887_06861 [Cichorium endivia]|nr:hypothetical protein L1887_06861 [Cichorium endivia]
MLSGMLVYSERSIEGQTGFLMNLVRQHDHMNVHELIDPHIRDHISSRSFDTVKTLAYDCISLNLKQRPSMAMVILMIEHALDIEGYPGSDFLGFTNMIAGDFLNLHPSVLKFPFTIEKQNEAPPNMECNYKFRVQAVMAPNGETKNDITTSMFDKKNNVVEEFMLSAVYIPVQEESEKVLPQKRRWISKFFICL